MAKDIYGAINEIMQEVGYVQKQKGANLNYTYAGESALIEAVRPSMVAHGVICFVEDVDDFQMREYQTAKGSQMVNVTIRGRVRFAHAESGTSILVTARGEGSDSGDKASNKALTGMYKYALRQTFCIETGDDPDQFASDERTTPSKQVVQQAPKAPAPPMVKEAQKQGGVEMPANVREAWERTTSKGTRYGDLSGDKLEFIINSEKSGEPSKNAAKLVLGWKIDHPEN